MGSDKILNTRLSLKERQFTSRTRTLILVAQVTVVLALLVVWLSAGSIRNSKNLWVLFFYSFPSEFLISTVPHEPVLLYFAKFYSPLTVCLVSVTGTLITEILNYSVFKYVADTSLLQKIRHTRAVNRLIRLFQKAPFAALWVAGFTPVPFYPFRMFVVLARYPVTKYILALFLARTPRFYILAYVGRAVRIPDYLLIVLIVLIVAALNANLIRATLKKRQTERRSTS